MIVYDRLWTTMKEKGVTQYKLIYYYGISPSQITRLKRNANVNTHTINMLCDILECDIIDIMEYIPEGKNSSNSWTQFYFVYPICLTSCLLGFITEIFSEFLIYSNTHTFISVSSESNGCARTDIWLVIICWHLFKLSIMEMTLYCINTDKTNKKHWR